MLEVIQEQFRQDGTQRRFPICPRPYPWNRRTRSMKTNGAFDDEGPASLPPVQRGQRLLLRFVTIVLPKPLA